MIPSNDKNEKTLKETNTSRDVFESISTRFKTKTDNKLDNVPITKEFQDHEIKQIYFKEEKKITTGLGKQSSIFFSEEIKFFTVVESPLNQKDKEIMTNFKNPSLETRQKAYLPDETDFNTILSSGNSNEKDDASALDKIVFTNEVLFYMIIYVLIAVLFVYLLFVYVIKIIRFIKNEKRKEKLKWQYEVVNGD